MESLIQIMGILKVPNIEGERVQRFASFKYIARHSNDAILAASVNKGLQDIVQAGGLTEIKDETKSSIDVTNYRFWPIEEFKHFDVAINRLSEDLPDDLSAMKVSA